MKNDFIGLLAEDSHSLLIGLLAILKSGNSVVPISPGFPVERIEFITADCRVKVILADKKNYPLAQQVVRGSSCPVQVICIDDIQFKEREKISRSAGTVQEDMDKPCYVIYTSGSTGKPKGVPITYTNLVPLLMWFHNYFRLGGHTRVLQNLSYTFDFGMFELLTTLLAGGALYFFNKKALNDLNEYIDFIHMHQVNCIHTTPSFISNITGVGRKLSPLKLVHLGGEPLNRKLVVETSKLVGENCYIYNGYGPTETTINSSIFSLKVEPGGLMDIPDSIPIGKPSANNIIYIMDAGGNFQPVGITGELYIGGVGVAAGYINKPELTNEKFLQGVQGGGFFKKSPPGLQGQKFYKTGDLGRWLPGGDIEFFGRIDHQVKVRGFRIELGEIENRLLNYKKIKECAVTVREGANGNKYLCAYLVVHSPVDPGALKDYLSGYLPDYMIPSYFVQIDKMPLTTSGKIDLGALPAPRLEAGDGFTAPRDDIEEKLAGLWAEVLGIEKSKISIDANFFELGGHSLKATLLAAKIHKKFQVKLSLAEIFKSPFIKGLAIVIKEAAREKYISLAPVEKKDYYELSPAQKRLYILQQMDEQGRGIAYNIPSLWHLEGAVDKNRFADVFRKLTQRHEILRTYFQIVNGEPVQRVHDEIDFEIEYPGLAGEDAGGKHFIRVFDLSKAPLLRVGLIKEQENKHRLILDMHHIISDGISMEIFVKDFIMFYGDEDLPPLRIQYKDYSQWQNNLVRSHTIKTQEDYWLREMAGEIPVLELPLDYPRPAVKKSAGNRLQLDTGRELTDRLRRLAQTIGATPFMILLAVFNLLLSKLSNQEDIIVGSPIAGRFHPDLENIIGVFINTLAFRNYPCAAKPFSRFLEEVKENCLRAFENQYYQYEELVEKVQINRDLSRNPLFDVMLVLPTMSRDRVTIPGLGLTPIDHHMQVSKFDIILTAVEGAEQFEFFITYSTALFKQETVYKFIGYFKRILSAILVERALESDPEISSLDILSAGEREQLLYRFNGPVREYPTEKTVHRLFAEQVERTPDRIAVFSSGQTRANTDDLPMAVTYRELNEKSGRLAYILNEKGVRADDIIGIKIGRSLEMIIGIMGILKAGGAYMPIDPGYPPERIEYMLKDSRANFLINKSEARISKYETNPNIQKINDPNKNIEDLTVLNFDHLDFELVSNFEFRISNFNSSNLAYVIYTSGSSGRPKGVMVGHRNLMNLLTGLKERIYDAYSRYLKIALVAPFVFDASIKQVFGALLLGHGLYIVPGTDRLDSDRLRRFFLDHKIDITDVTPAHLYMLSETGIPRADESLKPVSNPHHFIVGGDALSPRLVERFYNNFAPGERPKITNIYGPTECTVDSTCFDIPVDHLKLFVNLPIGNPLPNQSIYILNTQCNLQPIGVPGELCIAGDSVARGYLNQPELTADKFNRSYRSYKTYILYKTGDLARWLPDPVQQERHIIEFLGRIDRQVKIRGYRIELEEIENRLRVFAGIKEAVVIMPQSEGTDKYICAYIVTEKGYGLGTLKDRLALSLPAHMMPSHIVTLEKIPLTPHGKLDRKLLPAPETGTAGYSAPQGRLEETLATLWQEILDVRQIGREDNFFQRGGHSLKAIMLASKIRKELNAAVDLTHVFMYPTIKGLAEHIEKCTGVTYVSIGTVEQKEYYPLSSAQKRLYLLYQSDKAGTAYNMPAVFKLEGQLKKERLTGIFKELTRRHESFRTSFTQVEGEPVQRVHDNVDFEIAYYDLTTAEQGQIDKIFAHFIRAFDLSKAPLLRVALLAAGEDRHIIVFDMHHIISDGASMGILIREFMALYEGKPLPLNPVQYKDYAYWQSSGAWQESLKTAEVFWLEQFRETGNLPQLKLPTDFDRPSVRNFAGATFEFALSNDETAALKRAAKEEETTLYMVLLASYLVLLARLSGQEDITVGTPMIGREREELQYTIGMFVNTLALRNFPKVVYPFRHFLKEVKAKTLNAFKYQDYPFEKLVEEVASNLDKSRNPFFDVMFTFQNLDIPELRLPGLALIPYPLRSTTAKFDLNLICMEKNEALLFTCEYSTKLFKADTIGRFAGYFKDIITAITENRDIKLEDIQMSLPLSESKSALSLEAGGNFGF
ncbi:MAG TPA: amino acid adenylation domain-containing protein [Candidatus Deferrimicrobium sp.]|nr:amino acid adenylation domain-containing protein [Candidatus Deferrimicrobium sp.]